MSYFCPVVSEQLSEQKHETSLHSLSEESEDEGMLFADPEPDPPCSAPAAQPDSGIRRL